MDSIYSTLLEAKNGNKDSMMELIDKFTPIIKKYAFTLGYDDAYSDLVLAFIEAIHKMSIEGLKICEDAGLINYFRSVVYHEYIALSKYNRIRENNNIFVENIDDSNYCSDEYNELLISDLCNALSPLEAEIIFMIFFEHYTVQEIATKRNTSRQAVNNIKLKAIRKLRKYYFE